ncbi:Uma2 family endonuclease [Halomicronema sp. CCY15110]|uniref:Uma2 family endonuclease n=1 Tax=Halomicronema sp. CCY15110 TaxID=2767773 RepID=UPI00194F99DD|nr:Uma2 family endonuclease [Halomicronema sp. CCY15110]
MGSVQDSFIPALASAPPRETLPTMYDLPSEFPEEPGLPDEFHDLQPQLLSRTLRLAAYSRDDWFTGTDLNVYYDPNHVLWHKRPDWFLALNVPRLYNGDDLRMSYVVWQEQQPPHVVVEFLSPKTEREDLGRFYGAGDRVVDPRADQFPPPLAPVNTPPSKVEVYEQYLGVKHYIVYSRYTQRLRYFQLQSGRFQEQALQPENPRIWLPDLGIGLGIWQGLFEGIPSHWLRWCDRSGNWFWTDTETAQQRAERLAERLRSLGVDPDEVD